MSERQPYHFTPEQSAFFTERLNFGKRLGLALRTLAEENNGQLPEDVTEIAKWLAKNDFPMAGDTGPLFGVGVKSFELIYKGNLNDLTDPAQMILAAKQAPSRCTRSGGIECMFSPMGASSAWRRRAPADLPIAKTRSGQANRSPGSRMPAENVG